MADSALNALRPAIRAMRGYTPGEQRNQRVTKLNTNECPWPPSPTVGPAILEAAGDLRRYPNPVSQAVREAAAARYADAGITSDQVLVGNGSDDCLTILYRAVCAPGDSVACPWPTYGLYDVLAELQGVSIEHHQHSADWGLPASLISSTARLKLVANPNNPSGTLIPGDELRRLADASDGLVVVDEAYVDYAPSGTSLLPILGEHPNLVILRTFSKSFALAGARLGLLFAAPALVAELMKVKDSYNLDALAQAAAVAALTDVEHHQQLCQQGIAARTELEQLAAEHGWRCTASAANFILAEVGNDAERLYQALSERDILVRWWASDDLRHYLRISIGTAEDQAVLAAALRELV